MRRILFVNHTGGPSGPTSSLLLLLDGLGGRFELAVAHPGGSELEDALGAREIRSHVVGGLGLGAVPRLVRLMRNERVDLVYANNTGGASRNVFLAARLAGVPFVCHVRGMSATRGWRKLFYLSRVDAIVAVSHAAAEAVRRFSGATPVHVVHNGVELTPGPADRASIRGRVREELGIPPEAVALVQAAHVCPRKGQLYAVEIMPSLLKRVPAACLLVAGGLEHDLEYTSAITSRIEVDQTGRQVRLLGFRPDVPDLLRASDVFVHTATADPHPRAVIEAMAEGLPVVAFAVDGVAETVIDGETGRLVEPRDRDSLCAALAELGADAEQRARMGGAGRRRVEEHFTAEVTAGAVAAVLDKVLASRELPASG